MAFIYDLTDTWNAGATTFNAIRMNVTDVASAASSKLITLQVGGVERFGVDKAGVASFGGAVRSAGGSAASPAFSFSGDTNTGIFSPAADTLAFATGGAEVMRFTSSGSGGIGTATPNAAAQLEVSSTQRGFLPPRMTTDQREAIVNPPNGLMIYNVTSGKMQVNVPSVGAFLLSSDGVYTVGQEQPTLVVDFVKAWANLH